MCGVDPDPHTLRELLWMAKGRRTHDWSIASSLMAQQANINRDAKKRRKPFTPQDFDPYATTSTGAAKLPPVSVETAAKLLGATKGLTIHRPSSEISNPQISNHESSPCPKSKPETHTLS